MNRDVEAPVQSNANGYSPWVISDDPNFQPSPNQSLSPHLVDSIYDTPPNNLVQYHGPPVVRNQQSVLMEQFIPIILEPSNPSINPPRVVPNQPPALMEQFIPIVLEPSNPNINPPRVVPNQQPALMEQFIPIILEPSNQIPPNQRHELPLVQEFVSVEKVDTQVPAKATRASADATSTTTKAGDKPKTASPKKKNHAHTSGPNDWVVIMVLLAVEIMF